MSSRLPIAATAWWLKASLFSRSNDSAKQRQDDTRRIVDFDWNFSHRTRFPKQDCLRDSPHSR
jgi:hypothetical protein